MDKQTDLLEYFLANEKKQKRITLVSSLLFSIFAFAIIILSVVAFKQKKAIETKNKNIFSLNDSLIIASKKLDSLNQILNQRNINLNQEKVTLNRTAVLYEQKNIAINQELEKIADSISNYNPKHTNLSIKKPQIKAINDLVAKNNQLTYTLYIQYMGNKVAESEKLKTLFTQNKIIVPKLQLMRGLKFKSSVRYFHLTDKEKAIEVANLIEQSTGVAYNVQYITLKSPKQQLEVWVGK